MERSVESTSRRRLSELEVGQELQGTVTKVELFGAFVDIGAERDGLIHISNLRKERVNRVQDVVTVGQQVQVWIQHVDPNSGRIELTLNRPVQLKWNALKPGLRAKGKVVKIEKYGAFVDIGAERPGLVHVSEMSTEYVANPAQVVKEGEEVEVGVLEVDREKRQIKLTMKPAPEVPEEEVEEEEQQAFPSAMEYALRRAMDQGEEGAAAPPPPERSGSKVKRSRQTQEDILSRTLQHRIK